MANLREHMTVDDFTIDPGIFDGTPVFKGTRVPVRTLFEYLENDYSLASETLIQNAIESIGPGDFVKLELPVPEA